MHKAIIMFLLFALSSCSAKNISTDNEVKIPSSHSNEIVFNSQKDAEDFVETYDNSNPIFVTEKILRPDNENFKVKSGSDSVIKSFLQKINLTDLYDLESFGGNKKFTQKHCNLITAEAKKYMDYPDTESDSCDYNLNADHTYYGGDPLLVSMFQINDDYLFLNISGEGLGAMNFFNVLYDIKNKETINFTKDTKFANNMYYSENKIWFLNFSKIQASYDLNLKKFTDLSGNFYNKSYKWLTTQTEPNLIVTSFDNKKTVNLGIFERKSNEINDYRKFETYFETNESNTYFASMDGITCEDENSYIGCVATIRYGNLEKNGLKNSKTYEVNFEPFETMCFESANSALFLKDNLIITRSGCPSILELTIFDIKKEKFLFRNKNFNKEL